MAVSGTKNVGYPKTPCFADRNDDKCLAHVVQNLVFSPKGEAAVRKCSRQLFHAMHQANPYSTEEHKVEKHVEILSQARESVGMASTQAFENIVLDSFEAQGQLVEIYGFINQSDTESFKQLMQKELGCASDLETQTIADSLTKVMLSIEAEHPGRMEPFVGALKIDGMIYFFNAGELKTMLVKKLSVDVRELNFMHVIKIQGGKISLFACYSAYNSERSDSFIKELHRGFMKEFQTQLSGNENLTSVLEILKCQTQSIEEKIKEIPKGSLALEFCVFSKKGSHSFKAADPSKIFSEDSEGAKLEYSIFQVTKQAKHAPLRPKITYIKNREKTVIDRENRQATLGYHAGDYLIFGSEALCAALPIRGVLSTIQKMDVAGLSLEQMAQSLTRTASTNSPNGDITAMVVRLS